MDWCHIKFIIKFEANKMKRFTINPQYLKQITRIIILSFAIFCISFTLSYSQLTITPGSGNTTLCKGDVDTYTFANCTTSVFYTWTVDPPNVASITPISPCEVSVQWIEGHYLNAYTLTVTEEEVPVLLRFMSLIFPNHTLPPTKRLHARPQY